MAKETKILLFDFPTQYFAAATFLRFQERYESPTTKFRNNVFTLEQFMDWYAVKKGSFSYYDDWSGFNVPSRVFRAFRAGKFDPLTRKESAVLKLLRDIPEPFYVIASSEGEDSTLAHEVVHGLFYGNREYRRAVKRRVMRARGIPKGERRARQRVHDKLLAMGYCKAVLADELNAFAATGWMDGVPAPVRKALRPLVRDLQAIFQEHFAVDLSQKRGLVKRLERFITRVPYADFRKQLR